MRESPRRPKPHYAGTFSILRPASYRVGNGISYSLVLTVLHFYNDEVLYVFSVFPDIPNF